MRPAERLYSNITRHCHSSYGMAGTVALLTALLFRTVGTAQPSFSWEFASGVFVNAIERLANNDLLLSSGGNGYSTQNAPLIRMAPDGTVVWARWMPARSQGKVRELPNGDLLVLMSVDTSAFGQQPVVLRFDANGNFLQGTYFDLGIVAGGFQRTILTDQGRLVSMFIEFNDFYGLFSVDANGTNAWCRRYAMPNHPGSWGAIAPGSAGSIMLFYQNENGHLLFRKVGFSGQTQVERTYSFSGFQHARPLDVARVTSDRWAVLLKVFDPDVLEPAVVMFVDADGEVVSTHGYDHATTDFEVANYSRLYAMGGGRVLLSYTSDDPVHASCIFDTTGQVLAPLPLDTTLLGYSDILVNDTTSAYLMGCSNGTITLRTLDTVPGACEEVFTLTHVPKSAVSTLTSYPQQTIVPTAIPYTPVVTVPNTTLTPHCFSVAIDEPRTMPALVVFPDPVFGGLIEVRGLPAEQRALYILDVSGRVVATPAVAPDGKVDVSALRPGWYTVTSGDRRSSARFIRL